MCPVENIDRIYGPATVCGSQPCVSCSCRLRRRPLALVNGGRNPPLNGGVSFPGTVFEQLPSKMSRSGVKGKRSLAKRILDAAKEQKTGAGCDLGRAHKSAFSPPFNGGFAPPLTALQRQGAHAHLRRTTTRSHPVVGQDDKVAYRLVRES